jgi:ATP-dependent DNA helicase RecG
MAELGSFDETTGLQLLQHLNESDEHSRCEAKTSRQIGDSVAETICAFSNEPGLGGGFLLLGVAPMSGTLWPQYEAVGLRHTDQLQADIATQCRSRFNRPIRPQMRVDTVGSKNVLVVFIPEAAELDKPVYFESTGLPSGAFRRIGSIDQRCSEDDLRVFYGANHTA